MNTTLEDKLNAIVAKVDGSSLSDREKDELYESIAQGIRDSVYPVLIKYMPDDKLDALSGKTGKDAVDALAEIFHDAIAGGQVVSEAENVLDELFVDVSKALLAEGIS